MIRKGIALIVILLFIGMIINPSTGNITSFEDNTPPVTTHSLNPPEPDGENGWYASNVEVTLKAIDDSSGVKTIYYRISEGEWNNYSSDIVKFVLNHDCLIDGFIEYYAVDYAGNQEEIKSVNGIDIDQLTPEEINVTWDAYKECGFWYVDFFVIAEDACSGINRVEFFFNGGHYETITGRGPDFVFTFQWCVECRKQAFWFYCDDDARNVAYVYVDPSDIKPYPDNQNYFGFFLRFLDRFPILQKILDVLRLNSR